MSDADDTAPPPAKLSEEDAWSIVLVAWDNEGAHRAYLARFTSMEGLTIAGGRYRSVLAERPDDPMALRMREELLKRATVMGLASLPRTSHREGSVWARRIILLVALMGGAAAVGLAAILIKQLAALFGARS